MLVVKARYEDVRLRKLAIDLSVQQLLLKKAAIAYRNRRRESSSGSVKSVNCLCCDVVGGCAL